jgi:hypothetical protein
MSRIDTGCENDVVEADEVPVSVGDTIGENSYYFSLTRISSTAQLLDDVSVRLAGCSSRNRGVVYISFYRINE